MRALALLIALAGYAAGCASLGAAGAPAPAADQPLPELALRPWSGRGEIRLGPSGSKGKVVLLDLWASWCQPCREELPLLDELAHRLRDPGIQIVAVSVDEDRAAAEEIVRQRPHWHLTLAHAPELADRLQPPAMPSSYLIDARGRVQEIGVGFHPGDIERLEAKLRALARARR
jgi:cytochrome c biogenesis protein CcmG/thiol:disulfide interchange protein DsbE